MGAFRAVMDGRLWVTRSLTFDHLYADEMSQNLLQTRAL